MPIETETLCALAEHERIVAVKDAKGDLFAGSRVMAAHRPGLLLRRRRAEPAAAGARRASASSASSATSPAAGYATMIAASTRGDLADGAARSTAGCSRRTRGHGPASQGVDPGQGRAAACSGLPERGRCARRWSTRPTTRSRSCAGLRRGRASRWSRRDEPPAPRARRRRRALPEGGLRVVALGGLGEIGRNMTVFEYDGRLLVVDCGVLFPEDHQPGVDLILPDFDVHPGPARRHRGDRAHPRPRGPHRRGAVPAARSKPDIPLVGSRLTLALVEAKLQEHRIKPVHARGARGADASGSGRSTASSSRSTTRSRTRSRSPIRTAGRHWCCTPATSRWTSCRSTAGSPTCGRSPGSATRASTCSWSTPPTPRCPGSSRPEREIGPVLDRVFAQATERIIVASLRLPRAPRAAGARRRRDAPAARSRFVGRSMVRNMGIARDLGYLRRARRAAGRRQGARRPARRRDRAHLHRLAGRADGGAVPDGQPATTGHPDRRGRHRDPRVVADPGQRERRSTG